MHPLESPVVQPHIALTVWADVSVWAVHNRLWQALMMLRHRHVHGLRMWAAHGHGWWNLLWDRDKRWWLRWWNVSPGLSGRVLMRSMSGSSNVRSGLSGCMLMSSMGGSLQLWITGSSDRLRRSTSKHNILKPYSMSRYINHVACSQSDLIQPDSIAQNMGDSNLFLNGCSKLLEDIAHRGRLRNLFRHDGLNMDIGPV